MTKLRIDNTFYGVPEVAHLPYFVFSYKGIKGNKIYFDKLLAWGENLKCKLNTESDYQPGEIDEHKIFYLNLKNLIKGGNNYYYYSTGLNLNILNDLPYITSSHVINFYDSLEQRIYKSNKLNVKIFSTYFSADLLPEVMNQLFIEKNCRYLEQLIEDQKQSVLDKLKKISQMTNELKWITKNPGSQLTSSINPLITKDEDWYGAYYL